MTDIKVLGISRTYTPDQADQLDDGIIFAQMRLQLNRSAEDTGIEINWDTLHEHKRVVKNCYCGDEHGDFPCHRPTVFIEYRSTARGRTTNPLTEPPTDHGDSTDSISYSEMRGLQ